jgi:hypothetical protein
MLSVDKTMKEIEAELKQTGNKQVPLMDNTINEELDSEGIKLAVWTQDPFRLMVAAFAFTAICLLPLCYALGKALAIIVGGLFALLALTLALRTQRALLVAGKDMLAIKSGAGGHASSTQINSNIKAIHWLTRDGLDFELHDGKHLKFYNTTGDISWFINSIRSQLCISQSMRDAKQGRKLFYLAIAAISALFISAIIKGFFTPVFTSFLIVNVALRLAEMTTATAPSRPTPKGFRPSVPPPSRFFYGHSPRRFKNIAAGAAAGGLGSYFASDDAYGDNFSSDDDLSSSTSAFDDDLSSSLHDNFYNTDLDINPATGLPMTGGVDVMGNPYGTDIHDSLFSGSDTFSDMSSSSFDDMGSSSFDDPF